MLDISTPGSPPTSCRTSTAGRCSGSIHAEVVAADRPDTLSCSSTSRSTPPARAPRGTSARPTARPSSTSTAAARSRGTGRASSSATRSCACPSRSTSSPTCAASSGCSSTCSREYGVDGYRVEGRSGVWVRRPLVRRQGRRDRRARAARRDDARLRAQLRQLARGLPRHHPVRDHGCRGHDVSEVVGADVAPADVLDSVVPAFQAEYAGVARRERAAAPGRPRHPDAGIRSRADASSCASRSATPRRPIERKPEWIKTQAKMGPEYTALHSLVKDEGLHTVCQEAGCPNIYECWEDREATFLIGGSQCTRRCDFCQIDTGKPADYDTDEPRRVAESVVRMQLRYATVTGVARDDLPDGGAWLHAETVRRIHAENPGTGVEILATDFNGDPALLARGVRLAPRGVRAQRRDGAAHLQAHPPGVPLRALARRPHAGARGRAHHEVEPHPRHGRGARRGRAGAAGPPRRRHRHHHDHAVPAAVAAAPAGRPLGQARGVRRVQGGGGAHRLPRRARGSARALVVPRRAALGAVDALEGPRHPAAPRAPRARTSRTRRDVAQAVSLDAGRCDAAAVGASVRAGHRQHVAVGVRGSPAARRRSRRGRARTRAPRTGRRRRARRRGSSCS